MYHIVKYIAYFMYIELALKNANETFALRLQSATALVHRFVYFSFM